MCGLEAHIDRSRDDEVTEFEEARFSEPLTPEDKKGTDPLEWADADLGLFVKKVAARVRKTCEEQAKTRDIVWQGACVYLLVKSTLNMNSENTRIAVEDLVISGEKLGNWEVVIRRTDVD